MDYGRLPIDGQVAAFETLLLRNQVLARVLSRAAVLDLPDWYLVAGCLYQTVWNVVTGQPPDAGILDYDLAYFDAADLSWEAEDTVIRDGHRLFGGACMPRTGWPTCSTSSCGPIRCSRPATSTRSRRPGGGRSGHR